MSTDKYIVAIEIGSSKITGAVGTRSPRGVVTVLGVDSEPLTGGVKRGLVVKSDEVESKINRLIKKLNNRIGSSKKIKSVYVGIAGQSLHAEDHMLSRDYPENTPITEEIIRLLQEEAKGMPIAGADVLEVVRTGVLVDDTPRVGKEEIAGSNLKMNLKLITAREELKKSVSRCIPHDISVLRYIPTDLSTAYVALSNEDRQAGVMLVDFGADTTVVSIYKDGVLQYLSTIPLGGSNITRDIMSLKVTDSEAESFKIRLGSAKMMGEESNISLRGERSSEIKSLDLAKVVKARIEEIVANVNAHFDYAKCDAKHLGAGMVIIGGASRLSNLSELLAEKCDIRVRKGSLRQDMLLDVDSQAKMADYLQIFGLLYCGREDCVEVIARPGEPVTVNTPVASVIEEEEEEQMTKSERREKERIEKERKKREEQERKRQQKEDEKRRKEEEKAKRAAERANEPSFFGRVKDTLNEWTKKAEQILGEDENDNF